VWNILNPYYNSKILILCVCVLSLIKVLRAVCFLRQVVSVQLFST